MTHTAAKVVTSRVRNELGATEGRSLAQALTGKGRRTPYNLIRYIEITNLID